MYVKLLQNKQGETNFMLRYLIIILLCFLLSACTSKEEKALIKIYQKNKIYHKKLQQTEKLQLKENGITKVLLTATYMFKPIKNKTDTRDELFIIGISIDGDEEKNLTSNGFSLTLDGKTPKEMKMISAKDTRLKNLSFVSDWTQFYVVRFPHTSKKDLTLIFNSNTFGKGVLHFAKVAKYVIKKDSIF